MEPPRQDSPPPSALKSGEEWRTELNAAETIAGQLRDRLRSLKKSAENEAGSADDQTADWLETAIERLDNGISEADQISDTLSSLDCDMPEFNRS